MKKIKTKKINPKFSYNLKFFTLTCPMISYFYYTLVKIISTAKLFPSKYFALQVKFNDDATKAGNESSRENIFKPKLANKFII